jgi:hypothetical protein
MESGRPIKFIEHCGTRQCSIALTAKPTDDGRFSILIESISEHHDAHAFQGVLYALLRMALLRSVEMGFLEEVVNNTRKMHGNEAVDRIAKILNKGPEDTIDADLEKVRNSEVDSFLNSLQADFLSKKKAAKPKDTE